MSEDPVLLLNHRSVNAVALTSFTVMSLIISSVRSPGRHSLHSVSQNNFQTGGEEATLARK